MKLLRLHFLTLILVFGVASLVKADINYGAFDGDTLTYVDVRESSSSEPLPLYGQPAIFGDMLRFPGTGFQSTSTNGQIDFLNGRLTFMIEADPGTTLSSVTIREFGAFFTFGEDSISSVGASASVETLEGSLSLGSLDFTAFGSNVPENGSWSESFTLNFPETTKITLTLDNSLFTFADNPGVAFISKQGIDIIPGGAVIPEPTAAAVLAFGLMGLAIRSRRR